MNHLIHTAAPIPASPRSRIPLLARVLPSRAFRDGGGVGDLGGLRGLIAITLLVSASLGSSQGLLMGQTDEQANEQSDQPANEQPVTTTEATTSVGTISEFEPDSIVIRTERSTEPLRYSYTKSTTFVDQSGAPVSMAVVKSGLPVTVYYAREGDRMVASKVIVRRTTEKAEPGRVIEKKTTTTTTDK